TTIATTTTKPATALTVSQAFTATKVGAPIGLNTTVSNPSANAVAATVVLTISGNSLPHYLEAKAGTGNWSCSAYVHVPAATNSYTCTSTIAAGSSSVVTISSGSSISGAVGTAVSSTASVTPGPVTASASAAYS
ncbi:MAG: hypothetical protein AB7N61_26245, partial [Acidimicrobiia bacterium]